MVYTVSDDVYLEEGNRGEEKTGKKKVLFLCTSNSARSQMAEGLLRALYGDRYEAYSAGIEATAVDPRAVSVMTELGIDISGQRSKSAEELGDVVFDLAVTVCDRAKEACPVCSTDLDLPSRAPKAREVVHKCFDDPASASGTEEVQLRAFRQVRDEIKEWIIERFR
ncbi:MAG: arsenate reductase ArsC [Methanothrix sp.]|nr:arsenate reductase ArsC [Methanothrix sp.]